MGKLWVKLSNYFIAKGEFERAREILDEAIGSIDNSKDFGIIFDAYCKFEEEMIKGLADERVRKEENVSKEDNVDEHIEFRMQRL